MDTLMFDLADLAHIVKRLGDSVLGALDTDDTAESVVHLLAELRTQRKALADLEAFVEAAAVKRIPYSKAPQRIAGQVVEVRGGSSKWGAWRHDDLAWAVCRDIATDKETGEVVPEVAQIIDQARSALLNCASIAYWRTTQLKPLGIDAADYAERVPSRRTVSLTPAVDEAGASEQVAS